MNTSNQQYYGGNAYQTRSDLLSGLRTEGLGLGSVFPSQGASQQFYPQHQAQQNNHSYRTAESLRDISALQASLEDQLAAMRLQSGAQLGNSHYQNGYGQQQQQQQQQQYAEQYGNSNNHQQQQQQQYMQMQLQQQFARQQAAVQQQKAELLRLQALQKQQQYGQQQYNQQQLAAQQRFLLSQLQSGNDGFENGSSHHADLMNQAQTAAASAQEQRQAAQASIQASLRQRQVQQLYQTMGLENDVHGGATYNELSQQSMQQQQQQQLHLQNILNRHTRKVSSEGPSPARTPLNQRSWRGGAVPGEDRLPTPPGQRGGSPASSVQSRKGMRPSSGTTDSIMSMRSRTVTPSIVIDDSASEDSRAQSDDQVEGDQTPETSEEDLEVNTPLAKAQSTTPTPHQMQAPKQLANSLYGSLGRGAVACAPTSTCSTPPIPAPKAISRAIHLSAAPTHRAFKTNGSASDSNTPINNAGLTLPPIQPRRQPKGQPNDFQKVNFQARMNSRLRKDAMSKLCASPRAASFGGNGMSFGARLSSAGSSVGVGAAR
ncbi:hypothetical protein NDA11_002536 [Ustilago hordei]|uniref:Uncharacterized protein n=1 Tax=Ustilago hordei TaxID=120017 RepID=I2FR92_USTHO|nr:uncharacterized protein UHO2_05577 [Ustilago hordei]KAJ1042701.1 hypothetical protein NDA10_006636 [Ustilago hordei]KAJ1572728.1 hypothetical protein NDA15_002069 [Ustilago hordei]KAJ1575192.1 hypothetical protein NDA11_002536 [Ustilago hordei]KAJ1575686.1 hypothetical protein NDA12_002389 [Ustilago hordei]KAJ1598142.1 hypothetical protein NDA14_005933 [Ustilago hordei]